MKPEGIEFIREAFDMPWLSEGAWVRARGRRGIVMGASGSYVNVRLEDQELSLPYHPTEIEAFEG